MRNRLLVVATALLLSYPVLGNDDSTKVSHPRYFNQLLSGPWIGRWNHGVSFTGSLVQGIRFGRLYAGAGVGFDSYQQWKIVPFTINVGFEYARLNDNAFFVQGGVGSATASNPMLNDTGFVDYDEKGGRTRQLAIGYRFAASPQWNLYFTLGFKHQQLRYSELWWGGTGQPIWRRTTLTIERISVQIGMGLR